MLGLVNSDFTVVILDSIGLGLVIQLLRRGFVGLFLDPGAVLGGCLQHTIRATNVHRMEATHLGLYAAKCPSTKSRRLHESTELEAPNRVTARKDLSAIRSRGPG
jgi:hypothetical protein